MNERLRQFAEGAAEAAISATRGNYFNNKERGELHELREELNSDVSLVRREAVRKVIAGMTVGEDVSALFPDILKCLQSKDLETKRLVYLYIVNHAHHDPEVSLLSVNTFVRDSESKSPLVRMLALRTMGSLQLPNIADYIDEPLRRAVVDDKAVVRRTAAICIGKLFRACREYFEDMELAASLGHLLADPEPSVVSAALSVYETCPGIPLEIDSALVARLSKHIPNAGDWSLPAILDIFLLFCQQSSREQAVVVLRHCGPLLANANPAVIVPAARVVINYIHRFPDLVANFDRRLSACFATLLASPGGCSKEMQYAVLRMLGGLVRHLPSAAPPLQAVLVYFHDPLYVRIAKLSLMAGLATRDNILDILSELSEYAKDVNVAFAASAIGTLGTLASRFAAVDQNARRCVLQMLVDVCRLGLGHLFQAAVVSLRAVYDPVLDRDLDLAGSLLLAFFHRPSLLESPDSRAALLWLAARSADHRLAVRVFQVFSFQEEALPVQFELLHASFHLLCRAKEGGSVECVAQVEALLRTVLAIAEQSIESVDLNEQALLFRKLLEADFGSLPEDGRLPRCPSSPHTGDWCLRELGRLSTVYHEPVDAAPEDGPQAAPAAEPGEPGEAVDRGRRDYLTEYL